MLPLATSMSLKEIAGLFVLATEDVGDDAAMRLRSWLLGEKVHSGKFLGWFCDRKEEDSPETLPC